MGGPSDIRTTVSANADGYLRTMEAAARGTRDFERVATTSLNKVGRAAQVADSDWARIFAPSTAAASEPPPLPGGGGGGGGGGWSDRFNAYQRRKGAADRWRAFSGFGRELGGLFGGGAGELMGAMLSPGMMGAGAIAGTLMANNRMAGEAAGSRQRSLQMQVGVQYYQELAINARRSNIEVSLLEQGLGHFQERVQSALGGNAADLQFFKSLDVSRRDLESLSREEVLGRVRKNIAGTADEFSRARKETQAFGQAGSLLDPLMAEKQQKLAQTALEVEVQANKRYAFQGVWEWMKKTASASDVDDEAWRRVGQGEQGTISEIKARMAAEADARQKARLQAEIDAQQLAEGDKLTPGLQTPWERRQLQMDALNNVQFRDPAMQGRARAGVWAEYFSGRAADAENPQERFRMERAAIRNRTFDPDPAMNEHYQQVHTLRAQEQMTASMAGLRSPIENLKENIKNIGEKYRIGGFSNDTEENRRMAARAVLEARDEYLAAASPGNLTGAAGIETAGGYSTVVNAMYGASVRSEAVKEAQGMVENNQYLAQIVNLLASQIGWQNFVVPWNGQ